MLWWTIILHDFPNISLIKYNTFLALELTDAVTAKYVPPFNEINLFYFGKNAFYFIWIRVIQ